ncbi:MAG: serine/threonine protein kinase, partial [Sorangiineae bacterium PRO1]|nr:serine/threonine protein kinase [Sorangiineae bacterium PRO1]
MSSGYGSGSGGKPKKSAAERSPVKVGELIADKYRVVEILAAGGMGVVVAAEHVQLGQRYAVKFLLSDAQHAQSVERFLREARAAACIESTRVCRVFDCGTLPDGSPYMVMEHLVGHDLGHELKTRGRLPVGETVDLLLQALEGIAEAHAVGIVHRDLKPSNLFLCQKPGRAREVKVLDFGISKLMATDESTEEDLTATATMLGSPRYMSPEQVQNAKNVDARTDIWSLGVILYQLLDGRSPFAGTTMGETIGKVLLHVPPPIRETRSDVPDGIGQVIDRCLERDRERRYRNVAELALALAPFGTPASQPSVQRITALLVGGQLGVPAAALAPTPASP